MELLAKLTALVLSIILHEVAHGYVAYRLGDPTARNAKRLTLNPLAHIDPIGSVILPIFLALSNSPVLFGWAKPVPYNPGYFRDFKKGTMLVGAAGPATNLIIAAICALLFRLFEPTGVLGFFLLQACVINVVLAVFNLIPIPPLDGSRIVMGLLPDELIPGYLSIERFGFIVIFLLLYFHVLDYVLVPIVRLVLRLLL